MLIVNELNWAFWCWPIARWNTSQDSSVRAVVIIVFSVLPANSLRPLKVYGNNIIKGLIFKRSVETLDYSVFLPTIN